MKVKPGKKLAVLMMALVLTGCGSESNGTSDSWSGGSSYTEMNNWNNEDLYKSDADTGINNSYADDSEMDDAYSETDSEETNAVAQEQEEMQKFNERQATGYAPADDDVDFRYASDYSGYETIDFYCLRDACGYDVIYGEEKVTVDDIREVCESNPNISSYYKDFIVEYARRWLELYPETDFRNFYHNLKSLQIHESTEGGISQATLSSDAAACYIRAENAIYVLEGTDFSVGTNGYIILTHELTHAARVSSYTTADGTKVSVWFTGEDTFGTYLEEALITYFAYRMQGYGQEENIFYKSIYNYAEIICQCIEYDGADYMNHSIYYLMDCIADELGSREAARDMIATIDAEAIARYESHRDHVYKGEQYIETLHQNFMKLYLNQFFVDGMTREEAEGLYETFFIEMTRNFELVTENPIPIHEEAYRTAFEEYIADRIAE